MRTKKQGVNYFMVKKLSMTLLLIGAFVMTTGFSSNSTLSAKHHVVQSNGMQFVAAEKFSESTIQELIDKCLGNIQVEKEPEKNNNEKEKEQPKQEEPSTEETETNEEQEQPEQENKDENEAAEDTEQTNTNENEEQVEEPVEQEETETEESTNENNSQEQTEEQANEQAEETTQASDINEFEEQVVALTNEERQKHGLSDLEIDTELSKVARQKSEDMATNGYFSHNSPTYGSPFDMIQQSGISYRTAGENIAKGQRSPEEVVNAWMNSDGHRANILNENFTHIGVGYVEQGNHWTQQFIGK